jgi:hypothetical protein
MAIFQTLLRILIPGLNWRSEPHEVDRQWYLQLDSWDQEKDLWDQDGTVITY